MWNMKLLHLMGVLLTANLVKADDESLKTPKEVVGWVVNREVGQVSGVAVNSFGQPVIFHRGPVKFDAKLFDSTNRFLAENKGPIMEETVLILDRKSGAVLGSWGSNIFFMPHGITIDKEGNTWLTDIALHQAFKFPPGSEKPTLSLGKRFEPGSETDHFCKPTSVAVASSGEIFVSDGYCNSRVVKFDSKGCYMKTFSPKPDSLPMNIPHKVVLIEPRDLMCVADRENFRIVCMGAQLVKTKEDVEVFTIQEPNMGRVFASANHGEILYTVNNANPPDIPLKGFTVDTKTRKVLRYWGPEGGVFKNPHDIGISQDGREIYVAEVGPNKLTKFML